MTTPGEDGPPSEPVTFPLWPGWSPPETLDGRSVPEPGPAPLPEPELETDLLPELATEEAERRFERLRAATVLLVLVVASAVAAAIAVGAGIALVALAVRRAVG